MFATNMLSRRLITSQSPFQQISRRSPLAIRRSTNNTTTSTTATKDAATKSETIATTKAAEESTISFAERNPFIFQLGVATSKTSAADIMVQVVVEKKKIDEIDWKRNGIFVVFGFAYLGGFQYWLMVNKFNMWFPTRARFASLTFGEKLKDTAGMLDALKMVAFDVFVHLPLIYFPCYYTCKEIVTGTSWNPREY
jgi:hypothetical protein